MSRYLIVSPTGNFYSGNFVPETQYVLRAGDPTKADARLMLEPQFDSRLVAFALKYESAADAQAFLTHPDLVDPAALAGCVVAECEFDTKKPNATRPV